MSKKRSLMFSLVRGTMAILIALGVAALLIFISAEADTIGDRFAQTFTALRHLLVSPFLKNSGAISTKNISDVLAAMIPIMFTGLATCVMFSANQFNMGAEGGIMLGAFITGLVAVYAPIPGALLPIVAIIVGAAVVGVMMLVPSLLKVKMGVSEMVCSLMMNYVVMYLIKYVLNNFLADKTRGQIMTYPFQSNAALPQLVDNGSKLSWGFAIGILCVILTALFMYRTRWGYAIRMIGINQEFAKYSGMKVGAIIVLAQVLGGVLAGMGGGIEMLGRYPSYAWSSLPGYGWTGITVAILAGNNPAMVPLAAFFMAYLEKGCNLMSTYSGVPAQLIDIIQAVIFLFFAAEQFLAGYRQKLVVKSTQEELQRQAAQAAAEGSVK